MLNQPFIPGINPTLTLDIKFLNAFGFHLLLLLRNFASTHGVYHLLFTFLSMSFSGFNIRLIVVHEKCRGSVPCSLSLQHCLLNCVQLEWIHLKEWLVVLVN